jgi:hypothetical protein
VCNICGQDFGVEETRETSLPRKRSEKRVLLSLVLAVAAGALLLVASVEYRSSGGVSLTGRSRADRLRPPHIILIASGSEMEIGAGTIDRIDWTVPADQPNCHLTGQIESASDGAKDVHVLVTTADDYANLLNGQSATAYLRKDAATIVTLDIWLNTPGHMVLAIENAATDRIERRVQLSDVKATCT